MSLPPGPTSWAPWELIQRGRSPHAFMRACAASSQPVPPGEVADDIAPCLLPAPLYVLAAAPYVGELIDAAIWALVHLNVVAFMPARFHLPASEALLLASPGYILATTLVWVRFCQRWQASYTTLPSHLSGSARPSSPPCCGWSVCWFWCPASVPSSRSWSRPWPPHQPARSDRDIHGAACGAGG